MWSVRAVPAGEAPRLCSQLRNSGERAPFRGRLFFSLPRLWPQYRVFHIKSTHRVVWSPGRTRCTVCVHYVTRKCPSPVGSDMSCVLSVVSGLWGRDPHSQGGSLWEPGLRPCPGGQRGPHWVSALAYSSRRDAVRTLCLQTACTGSKQRSSGCVSVSNGTWLGRSVGVSGQGSGAGWRLAEGVSSQ